MSFLQERHRIQTKKQLITHQHDTNYTPARHPLHTKIIYYRYFFIPKSLILI